MASAKWMMKAGKVLRLVAINAAIFLMLLAALEIPARLLAPDYRDAYFTKEITRGFPIFRHRTRGHRVGEAQRDADLTRGDDARTRVLFVGDSVTFGYGVRYEDSYHEVAGRILERAGCRTFAHGVGDTHTNLTRLLASRQRPLILDDFGADLVLYQFNVNDVGVHDWRKKSRPEELKVRDRWEIFRISYINRSTLAKLVQSVGRREFERARHQDLRDSLEYDPRSNPKGFVQAWDEFADSLRDAQQLFRVRGARFAVVYIPEAIEVSSSDLDNEFRVDTRGISTWPADRVRVITDRLGIPFFDTREALRQFRAQYPNRRLYFPNDSNHPTLAGHATIGQAVARFLSSQVEGCGGTGGGVSPLSPHPDGA